MEPKNYARELLDDLDTEAGWALPKSECGAMILFCARCLTEENKGAAAATIIDGEAMCLAHALDPDRTEPRA